MQMAGHDALSNATVLQSNRYPKMNVINPPVHAVMHANDDMEPRSLGSVISPTYDRIGASLNPMLRPISTVDA